MLIRNKGVMRHIDNSVALLKRARKEILAAQRVTNSHKILIELGYLEVRCDQFINEVAHYSLPVVKTNKLLSDEKEDKKL